MVVGPLTRSLGKLRKQFKGAERASVTELGAGDAGFVVIFQGDRSRVVPLKVPISTGRWKRGYIILMDDTP